MHDCGAAIFAWRYSGVCGRKEIRQVFMARKLTPGQVVARSYPTWDYAMADHLVAWLQDCGYEIVQADAGTDDVVVPPSDLAGSPQLVHTG
jgi:hypothetical protein